MQTREFSGAIGVATAALLAACLCAGQGTQAAKPAMKMKAMTGSISQGKALTAQFRCTGCHNTQLQGRKGFSPSIRKTGALHDYSQAQFVKLMHTGITNDGGHVKKPMPVYAQMKTAQATAIYAYLETLK